MAKLPFFSKISTLTLTVSFLSAARYTLFCSLSYKIRGKLGTNHAVTYRASISSGRILMHYHCDCTAVGLDCAKQSSRAAIATLYRIGCSCYPCFGPSGSSRTFLSLDTCESLVLPKELGCTSCCFGTESAFQHWRKQSVSNTRVDPGGKYGHTSVPKRVLP